MEMLLSVLVLAFILALTSADILKGPGPPIHEGDGRYHKFIGIPAYQKIKQREQAYFEKHTSRVYYGVEVESIHFPYVAGLEILLQATVSACTATLLSREWLITAYHCWNDGFDQAQAFFVVLGSNYLTVGGERIMVTKGVYRHPDQSRYINLEGIGDKHVDLAMIQLPRKVDFSESIFPIALPTAEDKSRGLVSGQYISIIGYGLDETSRPMDYSSLKMITVEIMPIFDCNKLINFTLAEFCASPAYGQTACYGDSGGPAIAHSTKSKYLVGIVYGATGFICGETPSVMTRIMQQTSWILSYAKNSLPEFVGYHVDFPPDPHNTTYKETITIRVKRNS